MRSHGPVQFGPVVFRGSSGNIYMFCVFLLSQAANGYASYSRLLLLSPRRLKWRSGTDCAVCARLTHQRLAALKFTIDYSSSCFVSCFLVLFCIYKCTHPLPQQRQLKKNMNSLHTQSLTHRYIMDQS